MKKRNLFTFCGLGLLSLAAIAFCSTKNKGYAAVFAEGEEEPTVTEPIEEEPVVEEVFECSVVIGQAKHGKITVDKTEGHVGDIVKVTAKHDMFYIISSVSVNGTSLVESEETSGEFTFALVEGVNTITAKFVIDKDLLGDLSEIVDQVANKDWENLFSVDNVVRIVMFLTSGGLLFAMIRYYIKDKKLEEKLESAVKEVLRKQVPALTESTVKKAVEEIIIPYFIKTQVSIEEQENAILVFSRCMALAQENTPEAKIAITKELSSLKLSDKATIAAIEKHIMDFMAETDRRQKELLEKMAEMEAHNQKIIEEKKQEEIVEEIVEEPKEEENDFKPYE